MLITRTRQGFIGAALALALTTTGCSATADAEGKNGESGFTPPDRVTALVHTAPGGGTDLLAREIIAMMEKEEIIKPGTWTVENRDGGNSAVALSYLREQSGRGDLIAFFANVFLINKLVTPGVDVGYGDFTPVSALYQDTMAVAVSADGPYKSLEDFIKAAEKAPGTLVQAGGSQTSVDALSAQALQRETDTEWEFLSFPGGGERKTALLRGDAGLYMTEPLDMEENVKAGDMIPVAIMGSERVDMYPDVPSTEELGYGTGAPVQMRGIVGPPEMPADALAYFEDLFEELTETATWKDFLERSAAQSNFLKGAEFDEYLAESNEEHADLFRETGQLVNE